MRVRGSVATVHVVVWLVVGSMMTRDLRLMMSLRCCCCCCCSVVVVIVVSVAGCLVGCSGDYEHLGGRGMTSRIV